MSITRRGFLQSTTVAAGTSLLRAQSTPPVFLRHPNIQNVGADTATIIWTLPLQARGSVLVTDSAGKSREFTAQSSRFDAVDTGLGQTYYQYRATLTGLARATSYTYQVRVDGAAIGNAVPFRTEQPGSFRLLHFADSGEGSAEQIRLYRQMATEDVSLVLANGDLAYDLATHTSVEENYYGVYRDLMARVPFFATLGNHEYYTDSGNPSLAGRVTPTVGVPASDWGRYYSFDWGNAHFVALDTNVPLEQAAAGTGAMLRWLEEDLRRTRKFWRIAFFHHPGYATGKHQDGIEAARVRDHIVPILEAHGVQLVFNGHEHTYQRTYELRAGSVVPPQSGGIVYITSGGGGASTVQNAAHERIAQRSGSHHYVSADVRGPEVQLRTRVLDQVTDLDIHTLAPRPRIESVVNGASFAPDLASGGVLTIFGRNLCPEEAVPAASKVMLEAYGCSVTLNGAPLPMLFADAVQINAQVPFSFSGRGVLRVVTPNGAAETSIQVNAQAPTLFSNPQTPANVLATRRGGTLIDAEAPAQASERVTLFAAGLGAVEGSPNPGELPTVPLRVRAPIRVQIGNHEATVVSATLSTSVAGVYEVTFLLPAPGDATGASVQVVTDAAASNILSLPVRP